MTTFERFGRVWERRDGTKDETTLHEVFERREYLHAEFEAGDVWLDVGANIGAFALLAAPDVERVVAIEAEPSNFAALSRNIELNATNVVSIHAAVVDDDRPETFLWLSKSSCCHRAHVEISGRPKIVVPATSLAAALRDSKATKLKLDVEGAEFALLASVDDEVLAGLDEIVVELHPERTAAPRLVAWREIHGRLRDLFPVYAGPRRPPRGSYAKVLRFGR